MTKTLDLGCGDRIRNPFNADEVFGVDVVSNPELNVVGADLAIEPIPFPDETFDFVSAFDFIEHIPRVIYIPHRKNSFVDLMSEIYRVLKPDGIFYSFTPAFPQEPAWQDPTHVNIITKDTYPIYFCEPSNFAKRYGFTGSFQIEQQFWQVPHLISVLRKSKNV